MYSYGNAGSRSNSDECTPKQLGCGCFCGAIVVAGIFLLTGISYVQYYEVALVKGQFTGMNYEKLYQPGRHFIWPLHEFVPFTKTIHFLNLDLEVYTKDDGSGNAGGVAGTPLDLRIGIQYLLIQSQVVPLFQKYNLGYDSVLKNLAIETIKNNATLFSADEYLTARRTIEARFLDVVTSELRDVGLVEVEALQLKEVTFPSSFYRRKLDAGIQEQKNLIEEFNQNSTVIREKTKNEVVFIGNDATQQFKAFQAQGSLIVQQGKNNATRIRGAADVEGLRFLSTTLGITNQTQLLSLSYLVNIKEHSSVSAFVNFDDLGDKKQTTGP